MNCAGISIRERMITISTLRRANISRDLIRHDMQEHAVLKDVLQGLDDFKHGRFSDKSILDI